MSLEAFHGFQNIKGVLFFLKNKECQLVWCNLLLAEHCGFASIEEFCQAQSDFNIHPTDLAEQYREDDLQVVLSLLGIECSSDFNLKDTLDAFNYLGTWKLFQKHWRFGLNEMIKASSKRFFLSHLKKLIPSLTMDDIVTGRSGVRAMALGSDGDVIDDFKIIHNKKNIHVLNAPSPAATACLSIGETISVEYLKKK